MNAIAKSTSSTANNANMNAIEMQTSVSLECGARLSVSRRVCDQYGSIGIFVNVHSSGKLVAHQSFLVSLAISFRLAACEVVIFDFNQQLPKLSATDEAIIRAVVAAVANATPVQR